MTYLMTTNRHRIENGTNNEGHQTSCHLNEQSL